MEKLILRTLCLTLFALSSVGSGEVRIPPVFQDNMVLQQGMPVPVWGKAAPGEEVTVEFAGQKRSSRADKDGNWRVTLDALKASAEPRTLTIFGAIVNQKSGIENVVVGEVWVCSGQSNMEWRVKDSLNANQEAANAAYPAIRMFTAGHNRWSVCSPETVGNFSAVGYFFARELHRRLHVPVGMLNSSAGGTMIQPWMTPESAKAVPSLKAYWEDVASQIAQCRADPKAWQQRYKDAAAQIEKKREEWEQQALASDPGLKERWFEPATDTSGWRTIELPMHHADRGLNDVGTVWLRLDTKIPEVWVGKPLVLHLGPIDEIDYTYFNGKQVGSTWRDVPDFWRIPRRYTIPAEANTSARVTLAVRMYNLIGLMGLFGKPEQMALRLAEDPDTQPISLATTWRIRRGTEMDFGARPNVSIMPNPGPDGDFGVLYRHKIAPMVPYAIKGALWYQGESNAHEPELYAELFPALIRGWRDAWGQGDFPVYFVQLAGHQGRQRLPVERCSWADIRDAQGKGLALPNTGMVVATDIGDAADIHPRNKQDVGKRLALWALASDYGQKLEYSGPRYTGMKVRGGKITLKFDHARGLRLEGNPETGFAIAGEDKVFHPATAVVRRKTVAVTAADGNVPKPVAVRYGWGFHPSCFLYNAANLPASPFRTDDWPARDVRASLGPPSLRN